MPKKRRATASAGNEQVLIVIEDEEFQLDVEDATALRDDLNDVLERVGPNRVRNQLRFADGIGETTADLVARKFGTIADVREATDDELEAIPNVGSNVRMRIRNALQDESNR